MAREFRSKVTFVFLIAAILLAPWALGALVYFRDSPFARLVNSVFFSYSIVGISFALLEYILYKKERDGRGSEDSHS